MFLTDVNIRYYDQCQEGGHKQARFLLDKDEIKEIKAWKQSEDSEYPGHLSKTLEYAAKLGDFRQAYYGGPGHAFTEMLSWRLTTKGVLWITQRFGMDV
jgi:hypothetical protein